MMIEQPLDYDDVRDHARLQEQLRTPVCLDESIHTARIGEEAIAMGACHISRAALQVLAVSDFTNNGREDAEVRGFAEDRMAAEAEAEQFRRLAEEAREARDHHREALETIRCGGLFAR